MEIPAQTRSLGELKMTTGSRSVLSLTLCAQHARKNSEFGAKEQKGQQWCRRNCDGIGNDNARLNKRKFDVTENQKELGQWQAR